MGHLYHTPCPQSSQITSEEKVPRLYEPETVEQCFETLFPRPNKAFACMDLNGYGCMHKTKPAQTPVQEGEEPTKILPLAKELLELMAARGRRVSLPQEYGPQLTAIAPVDGLTPMHALVDKVNSVDFKKTT